MLLALLLAGAEPSSYGFLTRGTDASAHHALDYAKTVVGTPPNDSTMHDGEVPSACMDRPSPHKKRELMSTTPLRPLQLEEVHPRGHVLPTNLRDGNQVTYQTTIGQNPLSLTGHQPPRLDSNRNASHYTTTTNATCPASELRASYKNTVILGRRPDGYNEVLEDHTATPPPWWSAFREIIKEYQYYVHKPPRASKSRRRQRYQDRVARLSRKGGGVKKRRRLGPPGTSAPNPTVINDPAHKSLTNSALTNAILRFCIQTMCLYYRLLLVYTTGIAFINFVVMHCHLGDDYVAATSLAFAASLGALMGATAGIAAFVAFLWTVPVFAAILVNTMYGLILLVMLAGRLLGLALRRCPATTISCAFALVLIQWWRFCLYVAKVSLLGPARAVHLPIASAVGMTVLTAYQVCTVFLPRWQLAPPLRRLVAIAPIAAFNATCSVVRLAFLAVRTAILWLRGPAANVGSWLVILLYLTNSVSAAGEDTGTKLKPPMFSGERAEYQQWLIAFTFWVACYTQECSALLDGDEPEPPLPGDDDEEPANDMERRAMEIAHDKWSAKNRKLYGALGMAMPKWLMQSLFTSCRNHGVRAVAFLRDSFSAAQGNGNDRAAAMRRLQETHIDGKGDISEQDVRRQYDSMMLASADIVTAGAEAPDQLMLISMFENSLPPSYTVIRQMVRRNAHGNFLAYYNDLLAEVRAELQSRRPTAHAFNATAVPAQPDPSNAANDPMIAALVTALKVMGYTKENGRDGKKRGRETKEPYPSEPCLNCGMTNHMRDKCRKEKVTCRFCGKQGHAPPYCPHNPTSGGKRRALTPALRALVDREAGPTPLPSVAPGAPGTSASHAPTTYAAAVAAQHFTEAEAQMHAAAAAAQHSDPAAMATAYAAALRACGYASCAVAAAATAGLLPDSAPSLLPASARASQPKACKLVQAMVDSMATYFVVDKPEYLVRITNSNPGFTVLTADGVKPILAVGVAHVWIPDPDGVWACYEVPNVLLMTACGAVLYSVRMMRDLFSFQHNFEADGFIKMVARPPRPPHSRQRNRVLHSDCIQHRRRRCLLPYPRRRPPCGVSARRRGLRLPSRLDGHAAVAPVPASRLPLRAGLALRGRGHSWAPPAARRRHERHAACA